MVTLSKFLHDSLQRSSTTRVLCDSKVLRRKKSRKPFVTGPTLAGPAQAHIEELGVTPIVLNPSVHD